MSHSPEADYLTVHETARALGVSSPWVMNMIWDGKLPAEKVDRRWRIPVEAIQARMRHIEERDNKWRGVAPLKKVKRG